MKKLLGVAFCLCSAVCWVESGVITVSGYEEQTVSFECSHSIAGDNLKYFCRSQCNRKDILIKSENDRPYIRRGRFSLYDPKSGTFTVTITGLRKTDSGTYWCGVERAVFDTYTEVHLTVREAPTSTTTTTPKTTPSTAPHSTAPQPATSVYNQVTRPTDQLLYISVGLGVAALVFSLIVAAIIKVRLKAGKSEVTPPGTTVYYQETQFTEAVSCGLPNPRMAPKDAGSGETTLDDYDDTFQQPAADTVVNLHKGPNRNTSESCKNNCIYENFTTSPLEDDLIYTNII